METGEQVKTLSALIVSLACAGHSFAQVAPAPAREPLVVAQAPTGGASQGALPAATTGGAGSTLVALVAAGAAAALAATLSNSVMTTSNH